MNTQFKEWSGFHSVSDKALCGSLIRYSCLFLCVEFDEFTALFCKGLCQV